MGNITLDQVKHLVGMGGWRISGGHRAKIAVPSAEVNAAEIVDHILLLSNGSKEVVGVNLERVFVEMIGEDSPRQLLFHGPIKIKERIKKVEGGGWRMVEHIGLLLNLIHPANEDAFHKVWAEKRQQAELARRAEAEEVTRREAEESERHRAEYEARQKARLQGAQFEDISVHGDSVTVRFSGGIELKVVLCDREDVYDPNENATLCIVIGDEHL